MDSEFSQQFATTFWSVTSKKVKLKVYFFQITFCCFCFCKFKFTLQLFTKENYSSLFCLFLFLFSEKIIFLVLVANAKTLSECLNHCLMSTEHFGFHCESIMWYVQFFIEKHKISQNKM